jgi:hypothetical protein
MKTKQKKYYFENIFKYFIYIFYSITLVFSGAILNILVISTNDGRMPVYDKSWDLDTRTHFSYSNFDEVNNPNFSDRFNLFDKLYFSIGDIFECFGLISLLYFNVKLIFVIMKNGKKKRKM